MKGQFNSILEVNMELELIQIDCDGMGLAIFRHFFIPSNLIEKTGDFVRTENNAKKSDGSNRQEPYHMLKIASSFKAKEMGCWLPVSDFRR